MPNQTTIDKERGDFSSVVVVVVGGSSPLVDTLLLPRDSKEDPWGSKVVPITSRSTCACGRGTPRVRVTRESLLENHPTFDKFLSRTRTNEGRGFVTGVTDLRKCDPPR